MKRAFDIVICLFAIPFLLPLLVVIAMIVVKDSGRPVFYRGVRTGQYGKPFCIYKFRTMYPKAELLGTTTELNDPRITRVGRALRKYKIDEIPQMINILKGEMSIVGPRPEVEEHTSVYTNEEKKILLVKPGITDFASIRYIDLATELGSNDPHKVYVTKVRSEKNRLRLEYVDCRSFWVDIKIIFLTTCKILKKLFFLKEVDS